MLDKLKKLADQAKEKAGPLAEQAAQKANELAAEAKGKAGPLAEQAKGRATGFAVKAAPTVSQGIDKATGSIDKATSGRFTEHLTKVQSAAHDTVGKVGTAGQPSGSNPATPAAGEAPGTGGSVPPTVAQPADDLTGPAAVIAEPTAGTETGPLGEQPPGNITDASEALARQAAEAAETVQGQASYSAPSVAVDSDGPDAGAKPLITDEKA